MDLYKNKDINNHEYIELTLEFHGSFTYEECIKCKHLKHSSNLTCEEHIIKNIIE